MSSAELPANGTNGERTMQDDLGTSFRADRFYDRQMCAHLNPAMIEFIAKMDLLFIGTSAADGTCDVSLRAGPPGFVQVFAADLIGYPEYQGNGVMASLGNIVENPHIGLFMADFVTDLIGLHVNGTAQIVADDEVRRAHPDLPTERVRGRRAERWVLVHVEEAYIHCRKHIPRLVPIDRVRAWGTHNPEHKGGDYFGVAAERDLPR
ncbi:pyridoxamine 5'-phosphate oxidase family protein [Rhodococcus maanshanensis]|uniref:pyridoxamine 5'-phosphate oxidase family protein n=1 Tax=Rhodococcus maanshanensis TaxID=183556 RepID=UPI0022B3AE25|nr:pyridoxamine 5'-phosphate oxidase family protein [Rhodococcus maanshanensis]MCZ4554105.1 pyridoxamine 5'-phosphate oxidase family protein [Rhodococcus maanshanensis]